MGGCIGTRHSRPSSGIESTDETNLQQTGKKQPLRHEKPRWKSDVPLMESQLRSKRDEFWDTAPAFEGRKEIWDALKAAAYAAETNDFTLAQAIIDGANISLPNGTLLDCYDELGSRYQLPVYCLSAPANLVADGSETESPSPEPCLGQEILVKLRLSSTGHDTHMALRTGETILAAKRRLGALEQLEPFRQRWFFGGKLLADRMRVDQAQLQMGFVVQVAVAPPS